MGLQRAYPAHDDIQGILGTALTGVTAFTPKQIRTTGIVMPHVTSGDVFSMIFQMPHRKKLGSRLDSVHLHYIPIVAKDGDIAFTYAWGWYNHDTVIPDTLPNTGTVPDITLATTDQYKLKLSFMIQNLTHPGTESYSDILLVKLTAAAPADGTNWWTTGNEIAIAYMDAHYITDRNGSLTEASDT
jgi:hypothetical protein